MTRAAAAALAFLLALLPAAAALAVDQAAGDDAAGSGLETFELGPGQRVLISPDGSRVETEIGVVDGLQVAPGHTVVSRTRIGSSLNVASGRGAVACSRVGERETCVVNDGRGSRKVEGRAGGPAAPDLDRCFGAGGIAEILACAGRAMDAADP